MHEIVHFSLSSTANHTHAHFYNAQNSYFVYDDRQVKNSLVDPTVLFTMGKGVTPRALIWDMRGGFGSMKRSNAVYDQENDSQGNAVPNSAVWTSDQVDKIVEQPVARHPYQQALDNWTPETQSSLHGLLSAKNTLYWSDYLDLYYHPSSLLTLPDWEYHPTDYPKGRSRGAGESAFLDYSVGASQWEDMSNKGEYLDTHFRPMLENCDVMSGLSITSEVDSAWGAFTGLMLAELREDYIPKTTIFTWAIHDNAKLPMQRRVSRAQSVLPLVQNSDLYIPMGASPATMSNMGLDPSSQWHLGALYNFPLESFSVLSSLRKMDERLSMQALADMLQNGTQRNICSAFAAIEDRTIDYSVSGLSGQGNHVFSKTAVLRPPVEESAAPPTAQGKLQQLSLQDILNSTNPLADLSKDPWKHFGQDELTEKGTPLSALHRIECPQPFNQRPSLPDGIIGPHDHLYTSLTIDNGPYDDLNNMAKLLSMGLRTDESRDMAEDYYAQAEQYQFGSEEEDFDDD
uniref:Protein DML1 n=1 Tax=Blastobotrys adeninivorans TaxID=409370 RepID=A0A060T9H4_BLAAD